MADDPDDGELSDGGSWETVTVSSGSEDADGEAALVTTLGMLGRPRGRPSPLRRYWPPDYAEQLPRSGVGYRLAWVLLRPGALSAGPRAVWTRRQQVDMLVTSTMACVGRAEASRIDGGAVFGLRFAPSGSALVACAENGDVHSWDPRTHK